jgi:hypothetical protein
VLLEDIWLRILALYLSQRQPDKAIAIRGVVAETRSNAAPPERVLEQLRDVQAGLLRLWMLMRPAQDMA